MNPAFLVTVELSGWELLWARLEVGRVGRLERVDSTSSASDAARTWVETQLRARARHGSALSAEHPTVAAIRRLFRAAGCDPTRYRPSSEALLRRVLKGEELPSIQPLVDLNNALSVELAVPSCIMAVGTIEPPVVLRAGRASEEMESLRGPFSLAGKPLLADSHGPFGTPITDSVRVKIQRDTSAGWLVAYLPSGVVSRDFAERTLVELAEAAGVEVGEQFSVSSGSVR